MPRISGQVFNPTDQSISALSMKVEMVGDSGNVLWSKETRVVDEYVPAMGAKEGKNVDITGGASVKADGKTEFKVYFDGKLYNSYPIGKKERAKVESSPEVAKVAPKSETQTAPPVAPPPSSPAPATTTEPATETPTKNSVEEKTMKDLE